jgi:3-hydroxyisobutyrate dehydrogenase-like beta-hydroxyacid dehydrogenase
MAVGLLHPGEMGAAVGAQLRDVLWASAGRSEATAERARQAGLTDAGELAELVRRSDVILSICPPHGALELAHAVAGFTGTFLDANAVSPATAREIGAVIEDGGGRFVDGGIIGPPPGPGARTRLALCGPGADTVAALFANTAVDARVIDGEIGAASALKMAYAAWTKGSAALLLAVEQAAATLDVAAALHEEWGLSQPALAQRSHAARAAAVEKGWRWTGEMREIAATMRAAGVPDGFHAAAADVFDGFPRPAASART